jgi:hypothetical protein
VLLVVLLSAWIVFAIGYTQIGSADAPEQVIAGLLQQPALLIGSALGYIAFILGFWTVMRVYLIHDVWQRVADSVTVHNLAAAVDVAEQGQMVGALGEGLADSLDIGGF